MKTGRSVGKSSLAERTPSSARCTHRSWCAPSAPGNVGTRIDKIDRGDFDAVLLASDWAHPPSNCPIESAACGKPDRLRESTGQGRNSDRRSSLRAEGPARSLSGPLADQRMHLPRFFEAERSVVALARRQRTMQIRGHPRHGRARTLALRAVLGADGIALLHATEIGTVSDVARRMRSVRGRKGTLIREGPLSASRPPSRAIDSGSVQAATSRAFFVTPSANDAETHVRGAARRARSQLRSPIPSRHRSRSRPSRARATRWRHRRHGPPRRRA